MNPHVHCQCRPLYERLAATLLGADVRPITAMYPFYHTGSANDEMVYHESYHDELDHFF